MEPGEVMLVPGGIASFQVKRIGGPNWTAPHGANAPAKGPVVEKMHFWDDGPSSAPK
jgi:hypothetical protein